MLTFPYAPPHTHTHVWHLPQCHRPGFGEPRESTVFSRGRTQLTDFSQISAHASGAWRHSHYSIWYFYCDISEWQILSARAWTPALMLHLTNPCAKRKVFSLTKPKGKIYKTKSLGHYITNAASSTKQVLEAAPNKASAVRPPTIHHINYQN